MIEWISVKEGLPPISKTEDGYVNSVLAYWKPGSLADNLVQAMVVNTEYLQRNAEQFTHWMPLPAPPSKI